MTLSLVEYLMSYNTVAQWRALLPHSKEVVGLILGLALWSWYVLQVCVCGLSRFSNSLPSSKNMHES